jgi:ribose transport system ATP-binding protein
MVEIAKALSYDSEILIMDEPTSALSEKEIDELFTVIHTLRNRGVAIVYISHRLEELKHIVDRISIFRDGHSVSRMITNKIGMNEIVTVWSEKPGKQVSSKTKSTHKRKIAGSPEYYAQSVLHDISFDLYKVKSWVSRFDGAGRSELGRAIIGADR